MLAAYEQKNAANFDEAKADMRAVELFNSRAFRAYIDAHPGNLIAAANGSGLDVTGEEIRKLDEKIRKRDAVLTDVYKEMKKAATGKTPLFYRMMQKLDYFIKPENAPDAEEKKELISVLGEYVTKDCAPNSKEADAVCFAQSMRALKALIMRKQP